VGGKKGMVADNQQERLIKVGWVIGFVDGEGCFSIGFIKQPARIKRKGYKTGYQVSHEFVVTQGAKSIKSLHVIADFFKVGSILLNNRYDNHKEKLYRYVVRKREDLLKVVIPFFRRYNLYSAKHADFEKFAQCVELMEHKAHLSRDGLIKIARITETMNRRKPRYDLIRILRDHTLDAEK
jgi:hypothetical protein